MLQSQLGVAGWVEETGCWVTGVTGWIPGVGTEGDVHAVRNGITQLATATRSDFPGFDIRIFSRVDLCISTTQCI